MVLGGHLVSIASYISPSSVTVSPAIAGSLSNVPYSTNCIYGANSCVIPTPDVGYVIKNNGANLQSGDDTTIPRGLGQLLDQRWRRSRDWRLSVGGLLSQELRVLHNRRSTYRDLGI